MSHSFKQITPTDHFGWHASYFEVYDRLFCNFRGTGRPILEIGTDGGGGLMSYSEYFSSASIWGMDISPAPEHIKQHTVISHWQINAYSSEAVETASHALKFGGFQVIIDDGPHSVESQEFFVRFYPPLLSDTGMAIVEDIQDPTYIERLHRCLPEGFLGYAIDLRLADNRYDSLLFVIQRK